MTVARVGARVYMRAARPPREIVEAFRARSTCDIADAMHGFGVMTTEIRPLYERSAPFRGPAITVDITPGDGLLIRKALEYVEPGDVLVVNGHGCTDRAVLGGKFCVYASRAGVAGLVVDGAVRDMREIEGLGLSCYARGVSVRSGSTAHGGGEVNVPVACGTAVVFAGDVIVADADGVVVIPSPHAEDVLAALPSTLEQPSPEEEQVELPRKAQVEAALSERRVVARDTVFERDLSSLNPNGVGSYGS